MKPRFILASIAAMIAGCAPAPSPAAPTAPAPDAVVLAPLPPNVSSWPRPAADLSRDAVRRPDEILTFSGVQPGLTILELEAGDGYFTELFSHAVGPGGRVLMQNPPEFRSLVSEPVSARLAGNRLANVVEVWTPFSALSAPPGSVDLVTWLQGPHELFYRPDGATSALGAPEQVYPVIFQTLKPGGYFVVLDHAAAQGAPAETGHTLHRIDPARVRASAAAAGFIMEEESAVFSNPADSHDLSVFDDAIRGRSDQFLFRFVKPGSPP